MANTYLQNTTTTATDTKKFTWSMWFKRSLLGSPAQRIWNIYADTNNKAQVAFNTDDQFSYFDKLGGSEVWSQTPKMKLRDTSAWYHIVVAVDTTQGTEADRAKIYINGELQTELEAGGSYPSINASTGTQITTSSNNRRIGSNESANTHFNGLISHLHFVDGQALAPTVFGETDSTSGIWTIKTAPSLTYGTNGFFILKDGNTITDSSPNSNNFALAGGTLTKTEDCPDNNFATLNPLYVINASQMPTLTNGNTTGTSTSSGYNSGVASIAPAGSGKYYSEHKLISGTGGWNTNTLVGYSPTPNIIPNAPHDSNFFYGVLADGGAKQGATSRSGYAGTWTTGDIIRLALDLDNNRLYVGKNAYWSDGSGNWDEANINAYINLAASPAVAGENWFMMCGDKNTSTATWGNNFGNGYFGTTAVASAGTNASGNGIFEYDVPTGYTAISTKGLNL